MIEVVNVSKNFGDVKALSNVNFTVSEGQVVGFLGANGAGKTTTMDIICGCIGPDSGSVRISGFDILDNPVNAKKNIGYLPDEPPIHEDMYVEDFIRYAASLNLVPSNQIGSNVAKTMERLDLTHVKKRVIGNLSKGYKQRVALAQAIVHDPKVLVLDEPTEGLDPNQILEIRKLIQELKQHHTIILSSHILSEVENTCDEIVIIHQGEILKQGSRASLEASFSERRGAKYLMKVSGHLEEALKVLETYKAVTNSQRVGEQYLEYTLNGDESQIDLIVSDLVSKNIGVREIRPEVSTLEDVFFSLTRGIK